MMFLYQVNSILEGISCYDEDDAEAIQIASATVEEVQYLIEELTERVSDSMDHSENADTRSDAWFWEGNQNAYEFVLNCLENFLKKVEKS